MTLVGTYFDESGSHPGSPFLCVAGYLVTADNVIDMAGEWRAVLNEKSLPYFRMVACAHGNEPFDKLSDDECDYVARRMIPIIRRYVSYGVAVTVNEQDYRTIVPRHPELGSAYSFCARYCLAAVRNWANREKFEGDIAYFFESGHQSQSEANRIMTAIFKNPDQRKKQRYATHDFVDKKKMLPLQAADLLAWQWFTNSKRRALGKPPRADCIALIGPDDRRYEVTHWDEEKLQALARHPAIGGKANASQIIDAARGLSS